MNIIGTILYIIYCLAVFFIGNKYGVDGFLYMHYAMIAVGMIGIIISVILSDRTKVDPAELISPFPNDKD